MDTLIEQALQQHISGFMLMVAVRGLLLFSFFFTPWLPSLGFITICPHFASSRGSGRKAEMQTRDEKVCVCLSKKVKKR